MLPYVKKAASGDLALALREVVALKLGERLLDSVRPRSLNPLLDPGWILGLVRSPDRVRRRSLASQGRMQRIAPPLWAPVRSVRILV